MNVFENGQELRAKSICNSDCIYKAKVIYRTAKTVVIAEYVSRPMNGFGIVYKDDQGNDEFRDYEENKRCKIHMDEDGNEFIYPHGRYSMAAKYRA